MAESGEAPLGRLKSVSGIATALLPILYCGYLVYYFLDLSGSVKDAEDLGLGPTVLGLGIVGILFCIPLIWKLVKFFQGPPASGGKPRVWDSNDDEDDGGAAADAIIARYMARQAAEAASAPPRSPAPGGPAKRSFGRKSG